MSQPQSQNPQIDLSDLLRVAYICKRDVLEYKIRKLNRILALVNQHYKNAVESLEKMCGIFTYHVTYLEYSELKEAISYLERAFRHAVERMIYYEIPYDADIEKYENAFNVKFYYETKRLLGAILVEDGEIKPVVIWTDYQSVGYCEGEKNE